MALVTGETNQETFDQMVTAVASAAEGKKDVPLEAILQELRDSVKIVPTLPRTTKPKKPS